MNKNIIMKSLTVLTGIGLLNLAMIQAYATLLLLFEPSNYIIAQATSITPIVLAALGMLLIFRAIYPMIKSSSVADETTKESSK